MCHDQATCRNKLGTYSCDCNEGFHGDGFTCSGTKMFGHFVKSILMIFEKFVQTMTIVWRTHPYVVPMDNVST